MPSARFLYSKTDVGQAILPNATYFLPELRIPRHWWGGPPGPRGSPRTRSWLEESGSYTGEEADGGGGRGPGVRPTANADWPRPGKVCGIRHECLRHIGRRSVRNAGY